MGARRVVVLGGGVMGSAAAWRLATAGAEVELIEQFEPGHPWGSSHGSSRIFRLAYPQADYVRLATDALDLWQALQRITGTEVLTLTGAVDHGPASALDQLADQLTGAGHVATALTPREAAARWPHLRFDTAVLFHGAAGRLDADAAVRALQRAAARRGATITTGARAVSVVPTDGGARVRLHTGQELRADSVVVAVGAWTAGLVGSVIPGLPPLRVTQEQPVHLALPVGHDRWPSFIHHPGGELAVGGVYGLGSVDGVKIGEHAVGAEIDPRRRDRRPDPLLRQRLVRYARSWLPGVEAESATSTTCLYTSTPDHDFVIDRHRPVTVLAGFSGHGFKHATAVGELAARLTLDGVAAPPRFALGRRIRRQEVVRAS